MKITMLTAYYAPEVSSVTHLLSDLADDLAAAGETVTVVCNKATRGLDAETRALYRARTDERLPSGVRVLRVGSDAAEGTGLVARGMYFLKNTLSLLRTAKRVETDVYLINSMPPYLGVVGALLQKRAPAVYILQDLFPDSILAMGKLREGSLPARAFRWMERISYRRNTRLVTISEDMKATLLRKGVPADKLTVIPNWADADAIRPAARGENPLFDEKALARDGFYAVYAGALGVLQEPDVLLDAAKLLKEDAPEITLVLFGGGLLYDTLAARIKKEGLENVRLFPLEPVSRVSYVYSLGDVNLVPLKAGATGIAMPSKTWTAMAAGRPVLALADKGSAWEAQILASGGAVCPPGDARALADALIGLYRARETLPARGAKAREYLETVLSRHASTAAYHLLLSETAKKENKHV